MPFDAGNILCMSNVAFSVIKQFFRLSKWPIPRIQKGLSSWMVASFRYEMNLTYTFENFRRNIPHWISDWILQQNFTESFHLFHNLGTDDTGEPLALIASPNFLAVNLAA